MKKIKIEYIPITQQHYCCVPACIQMILLRKKLHLLSQEEIGYDLGLIVPKKQAHLFSKVRTGKKPAAGWGTQVGKFTINNFFKKRKLKLKEKYFRLQDIEDVKEFIIQNLRKGADIIVCFNYRKLYNQRGDYGHVSLIQEIEYNKNVTITLVDPEQDIPKLRRVKLDKLIKSIEFHSIKRRGGFWVITKV